MEKELQRRQALITGYCLAGIWNLVVPTNLMYQVCDTFNGSDTLKVKSHHVRRVAKIALSCGYV